nr:hypothetical protein [Akkermansiaceae bacterium]
MAVEILEVVDTHGGRMTRGHIFFCNTSDTPFGPLFDSYDEAERFQATLDDDPRRYDPVDLCERFYAF